MHHAGRIWTAVHMFPTPGVIQHNFSQKWCHLTCLCAWASEGIFPKGTTIGPGVGTCRPPFKYGPREHLVWPKSEYLVWPKWKMFPGGNNIFLNFFLLWPKLVKFGFYHSKYRNHPFLLQFSNSCPSSSTNMLVSHV